jgi:spermidine synthase
MRRHTLFVPLLMLGFSGMVAQVLLLRELLVNFYGNELSIGVVLACWLLAEAAGSMLGRGVERTDRKVDLYAVLQIIFSLSLPACILCSRLLVPITGSVPGEGFTLSAMLISSLSVLLVPAAAHGALFTAGCSILAHLTGSSGRAIGRVYLYEVLGTAIGGSVLTFLLMQRFPSLTISLALIPLNAGASLFLLYRHRPESSRSPALVVISILLAAGSLFLVVSRLDLKMQRFSLKWRWPRSEILFYQNSHYGSVAVTRYAGQSTLFSDGVPLYTFPVGDIELFENLAHFPLLTHPEPERVVILGGSAGGLVTEVLKHPVEHVYCVELDPLVLETAQRMAPPAVRHAFSDPRVVTALTDGRRFLQTTSSRFDVILIGVSDPADLQTNRLFTREFFELAKSRLRKNGIVAVLASGSLSSMSPELQRVNSGMLRTLEEVFPSIYVIPGDTNLYLAVNRPGVRNRGYQLDPEPLKTRLKARGLDVQLITPFYIDYRLNAGRLEWFVERTAVGYGEINRDFHPSGVIDGLCLWSARFQPRFSNLLQVVRKLYPKGLFAVLGSIVVVSIIFGLASKSNTLRVALPLSVFTTGFAGMIFDLTLMFIFQVLYGYVYTMLGALIASFMAGSGVGSFFVTSRLDRIPRPRRLFLLSELFVVVFAAALLLPSLLHRQVGAGGWPAGLPLLVFTPLCFTGGFLMGFQFPLANRMHLQFSSGAGKTAGLLNGADLLGGFVGGMVGGCVLLPVMGLTGSCTAVIMVKAAAFAYLVLSSRGGKR